MLYLLVNTQKLVPKFVYKIQVTLLIKGSQLTCSARERQNFGQQQIIGPSPVFF
jgi:hypothetical protein